MFGRKPRYEATRTCAAIGCGSPGIPCAHVDRRGRACEMGWCAKHVTAFEHKPYCKVHALMASGGDDTVVGEDSNPAIAWTLRWMAGAAADDVIAPLNILCSRRSEELLSEPVRRVFHTVTRVRAWEKQWKTVSPVGVGIRVALWIDERSPREIHISVNGRDCNVTTPPVGSEAREPNDDDLDWLCDEVLVPVTCALDEIIMTHGGVDDDHPRFAHLLAPPDDPEVAEMLEALRAISQPVRRAG